MSSVVPPPSEGNGDDPVSGDASTMPAGSASHRAAKSPKKSRLSRIPGPAILGVAALVISGYGVVHQPSDDPGKTYTTEPSAMSARLAAAPPTDGERPNAPEVSRSISRETLKRQAETQAQQRQQALSELSDKSKDRAAQLLKEKKRQERLEAKREAKKEKEQEQQGFTASTEGDDGDSSGSTSPGQWVLPVAGYSLTATFGETSSYWETYHTGLDFAAGSGTPLVAVTSGTITSAGYDGSYGNKTVLTLEDGTEIWYCHQTSISVSEGQSVSPGETIGTVGATGNVTGPHLHLEVRPGGGEPVDPATALEEHGVTP